MSDDWDHYTCHSVGIGGGCGLDCPVLLRGDCETEDEMLADVEPIKVKNKDFENFDRAMEIFK